LAVRKRRYSSNDQQKPPTTFIPICNPTNFQLTAANAILTKIMESVMAAVMVAPLMRNIRPYLIIHWYVIASIEPATINAVQDARFTLNEPVPVRYEIVAPSRMMMTILLKM